MGSLLYGAGLRQIECLALRVKDVDFAYRQITVRDGKGGKDRVTMLPEQVVQPLQARLGRVRTLHQRDLAAGHGEVSLPKALARKYPRAGREWAWQFVFPSKHLSADPESGAIRRHHVFPDTLGRAVKEAARAARIAKPVSCHTLRHSFATHLLEAGHDIRTVQDLRGQRVILDLHLAQLYGVQTKRLNEQVRRNVRRFPQEFSFVLTNQEAAILKSHFATSSWGGKRKPPRVFTEHGAIMAATVLNSSRGIEMSVYVVRAFVQLRDTLSANAGIARR